MKKDNISFTEDRKKEIAFTEAYTDAYTDAYNDSMKVLMCLA
jgi:hypothetical protein